MSRAAACLALAKLVDTIEHAIAVTTVDLDLDGCCGCGHDDAHAAEFGRRHPPELNDLCALLNDALPAGLYAAVARVADLNALVHAKA